MKIRLLTAVLAALSSTSIDAAFAQFNQVIVFGDSNVDSGFYKALSSPGAGSGVGGSNYNLSWPTAVAHGAGAPTSNPTPMNVQVLAAHYGLTANPANSANGTNYATSGAKNVTVNGSGTGGFTAAIPTVTQMQNYLTATSGVANPQALYIIWSGDNDVSYANGESSSVPGDPNAYVIQAANDLAAKIVVLKNAGARYFIVSGLAYGFPTGSTNAAKRALKLTYTNTLWVALDTAGVTYKRSDIESVREDIVTNRVSYGFDYVDTAAGHMACNPVVPNPSGSGTVTIGGAWSLLCSSDPAAPSQYLSPTAPQTMLFADDQHLATKGQSIVGNYLIQLASTIVTSAKSPHDFNGDAKSDILWRNTSGETGMWLMNGGALLSTPTLGVVPNNWSIVGQRDFNGDGKSDLLWLNSVGDIGIWFMNGGTLVSQGPLGNVGTTWKVVGTGDFNGDGKADILWRNTSGDLGIWFMNGGTLLSTAPLGNIPTIWSVQATGDFNGDGKADILWRNTSNDVGLWLMNGGTVLSTPSLGNVGATWSIAGTGDFNGDGKADILWRSTSNDVGLWLMNGGTLLSTPSLGNVGATWNVTSVGDYNGDGKADILWRSTSHDIGIWFMNGGTLTSTASLGNVGSAWLVQNAASN